MIIGGLKFSQDNLDSIKFSKIVNTRFGPKFLWSCNPTTSTTLCKFHILNQKWIDSKTRLLAMVRCGCYCWRIGWWSFQMEAHVTACEIVMWVLCECWVVFSTICYMKGVIREWFFLTNKNINLIIMVKSGSLEILFYYPHVTKIKKIIIWFVFD